MRSFFATKKPDTKPFKRSFQTNPIHPVNESQVPPADQKRPQVLSNSYRNPSTLKKASEERRQKKIFELKKQSFPKNIIPIQQSQQISLGEANGKPLPKIIENDDSLHVCDEDFDEKPVTIPNHRISDIYKPSKFLEPKNNNCGHRLETTARLCNSGTSSHTRHKSLSEAPNINYDAAKCTYTEECRDEPIYMLTEGFDNLMKDREYEDFCNIIGKSEWDEEKKWGFQRQYKLQKSYLEKKEGDFGELSEETSSTKKKMVSSIQSTQQRQGVRASDSNLQKKDLAGKLGLYNEKASGIKSITKSQNNMVSPSQKNSTSKLDGSVTLTMSNTSEGITYRSGYLSNMANLNTHNFNKLIATKKGSILEGKENSSRLLRMSNKGLDSNQTITRETKGSTVNNQKEQVGNLSILDKEGANIGSAILDNSNIIGPSVVTPKDPLGLFCDEHLDLPSIVIRKGSQPDEEDQINVVSKKLSFEPSVEIKESSTKKLSLAEQIEKWAEKVDNEVSTDVYENMLLNEYSCQPDAYYFETKQTEINPLMRAILVDWMAEVSEEFCMSRVSFYTAVSYVDRYLSAIPKVPKSQLQLVGATALFIAFKMEETEPVRMNSFINATDDAYTLDQLRDMELQICQALSWRLQSNTLFAWANWYMRKWDLFLQEYSSQNKTSKYIQNPFFLKKQDEKSYVKFREGIQILDLLLLDVETFQYNQRALVASILYLLVGKHYQEFSLSDIINKFPRSSAFLSKELEEFNAFFSVFLRDSFGFELQDLFPTIQYVSIFFNVKISCKMPFAVRRQANGKAYTEEFFSYQTHSPENLLLVKEIIRSKI